VKKKILAADLFCGAGGTSQGLLMAANSLHADLHLLAINHWQVAIDTHTVNHPEAQNLCTGVDVVDPLKLVPGGRLDILCASPECTHHSVARGGRPMNDQSRSSAWHILRWAQVLYIDNLIIENVPEFQSWGPLGANGRPMKSKRGELFQQFIASLKALGYRVDWRILNCADYGAPTTRRRLFLIARRGNRKIVWPEPTHVRPAAKDSTLPMFPDNRPHWKTAREIIDWNLPSKDIFDRKKPLAPNTLRRIQAGMKEFNGIHINLEKCFKEGLRPYLVVLRGTGTTASVDDPLRTVTAGGNHYGLVQPFLLPHRTFKNMNADDLQDPLRTVTANSADFALIESFTMQIDQTGGDGTLRGIDQPIGTVVTKANTCIVEPFLTTAGGTEGQGRNPQSIDKALGTVLTNDRRAICEPFIVPHFGERKGQSPRTHSLDEPTPTVTATKGAGSLVQLEPSLVTVTHSGGERHRSVDRPMPTVTRSMGEGVTEPYLVEYFGTGSTASVDEPLEAVTTKPRSALIIPQLIAEGHLVYRLEIRFRMLQPRELARAQGFPDDYQFTGNREAVVKQIGNAVPPPVSMALCGAVLG
jgi:DNA (cytosine-5)-methyltransferase 1